MQESLFGEPTRNAVLSQWHTPASLARRLATWVPRGALVLEPSFGGGSLIEAMVRAGQPTERIHGVELDIRFTAYCQRRFDGATLRTGDFLDRVQVTFESDYDAVIMNPPFEDNAHMRFVLRSLELAPVVIGVFPTSFEYSGERDAKLWASRGVVTRRARLPTRVNYGGEGVTGGGMFDSVALYIERRHEPRASNDVQLVREEVWTL